ncbi:hypothetical protein CHS0354_000222 [Potamilus streckersoni]|uniref:Chromo domain-containing protein n=1 Tax=Potamilus streckersoni TaxID=2493646 RepID=A0AAE0VGX0_9BIVA|nr:hypothetical protein CHS0354_000222 [Potamilus streckersoni]
MARSEKQDNSGIDTEGETDDSFEVDKIVGKSVINGEVRYKIRWWGYGPEDDTWEPLQNMQSCMDLLDIYEKRRQQKEDEKRKAQMKCSSTIQKDRKDLESGHSDFALDMYSKVKSKKQLENMSVGPVNNSDQVESANNESLGDKKRKVKTQRFSTEDEEGKIRRSSSGRKADSKMDHRQDNSSSMCEMEKVNMKDEDDSAVKKLKQMRPRKKKRKSSTSCQLSQNRMTSEMHVSDSIQKKEMHTTGVTLRNRSPFEAIKEPPVNASSNYQETNAIQLPEKSTYAEPTKESNLRIHKNDPVTNRTRPVKRKVGSLPSLADLLRRKDDCEVIYISSTDSDMSPTFKVDTDKSLEFPESRQSSINAEHCESLTKLNTGSRSSDIQKDGDSNNLIGLGKSVSSKRKTSSLAAVDSTNKTTASADVMKIKDKPTAQISKTSVTSSSAVEKFDDTKTRFSPGNVDKKNDGDPTKIVSYPGSSLIESIKIGKTVRENDSQGQDGCKRTNCDSGLNEMTNPCSFKTEEHRVPTGSVKQETDVDFDIELDDLDWAQLEEELKLKALSDEDFQRAVWNGNLHLVQQALSCSEMYDLESLDLSGKTLLMTAADKGNECLATCLLENGAMIDAQMKDGTTALMLAAQKGFPLMVDLLVKRGAKINRQTVDGNTALMMATRQGHVGLVKQLLLYGANFSAEDKDGLTALIYSQQSKYSETENAIVGHISRITLEYEKHLSIILNNTAKIVSTVFPLQCFILCEGTEFIIKFSHVREPTTPGVGFLLFIGHAMFLTDEVHCRFYGPCAVLSVYLNEVEQTSMTEEGNFAFSFNPVVDGNNQLVIKTMKASNSKVKLLVCAYKAQLLE